MSEVLIGNIIDLSSIDYYKHLSTVIFFSMCNFRCPYCQNYKLWNSGKRVRVEDLVSRVRENFLIDSVVISGGEPTIQFSPLEELCRKIKDLGLDVKLDTNGYYTERVEKLVVKELVDFISIDVKTTFEKYQNVTKVPDSGEKVKKTIQLLDREYDVGVELRTTFVPQLVSEEDILEIARFIKSLERIYMYSIQKFSSKDIPDKSLTIEPTKEQLLRLKSKIESRYNIFVQVKLD